MAKKRMIDTRFWIDDYISNLDPIEKLLFLYFLTNPYTDICGIYEIPLKHIALETGLDKEMVTKILARFEKDGKIFYEKGWIGVKNFPKHQLDNPKVSKGIQAGFKEAPKFILKKLNIDYDSLSYLIKDNLIKDKDKGEETSLSSKYKFEPKDLELATLLKDKIIENTPSFKEPSNLTSWADVIRLMREQDQRTFEQIEIIILWCQQNDFWQANILSAKKLRKQFDTLVAQMKRDAKMQTNKKAKVAFV